MDRHQFPEKMQRSLNGEKDVFSLVARRINEQSEYRGNIIFGCWWLYVFINFQILFLIFGMDYLFATVSGILELILKLFTFFLPVVLGSVGYHFGLKKGLKLWNQKNIPVVATGSRIVLFENGEVKSYPWTSFSGSAEIYTGKKALKMFLNSDPSVENLKHLYMEGLDDPKFIAETCLRLIIASRS